MKILDSSKALSVLVSDSTNGLGTVQPLECTVTEELNGIYECEFTVLTTDKHYEDLKNSGLIKVTVGDGSEQIFRVYFISEPINFVVTVKAQHISYDLSKIVVKPFTATGAVNVKNQLVTHILGSYPFTTWTDITNTTSTFTLDIPRSFRECLGGYEGSVLDVFRCEYEWDNLTVKMYARRGADNGVRIAYGKNLTDFVQEQNNENVYDGVYGYAVVDEVTYEASNYYNKTGATTPKILNVDFSSDYESGQTPTAADLLAKATTYATNNSIEVPSVNIKIDFIPLWQTEEYKNILQLERVSLGDTVHVYFDKLNVEASSRVIKTVWNALTNKYDSIELGDAKANMNTVINSAVNTAVDDKIGNLDIDVGFIEQDLNDLGKLIINGLGLYFTREALPSGGYRFYLHNQPTLANSDIQYYMSANGLMVSTDGGSTWSAGYDAQTGEMILQALSTITLRALEIYGSFLRFGDVNSNYIDVAPYSDSNSNPLGVSFDGTGTIRMQPQDKFYINNLASNESNYYNRLIMNKQGSAYQSNMFELVNYDDLNNYILANFIEMDAHMNPSSSSVYNRIVLSNYATANGVSNSANYFQFSAYSNRNSLTLYNYKPNGSSTSSPNPANYFYLDSQETIDAMSIVNYQYNNTKNANSFVMQSNSSGNTLYLRNYDTSSTSITNSLVMASDETTTLWSSNDLRMRSGGAVRVFANHSASASNGDYYNYQNGGQQDAYIGGYSLKLQCMNRIYLYWGSTRYYIEPATVSGTLVLKATAA